MRHFYTTMLAAMVATTSFAQSTVKTPSLLEANTIGNITTCPIKQQAKVLPFGAKKTNFRLPNATMRTALSPALRAKRAAAEDLPLITEQPKGTLYANYYGNELGYEIFWGGVVSTEIDGAAEDFVIADNGDVYLKDAMSTLRQGNWIKGHKAEGDTIVFNFPQKYYQQEAEDEKGNPTGEMEYCYLWRTVLSDGRDSFVPDSTSQTIKYVFRNDSLIRVDDFKEGIYLSLADADGVWVGFNDFRSTWVKCKDQKAVLPSTAKPEKYQLDYFFNANGQSDTRIINVATVDNAIYLGNLSDGNPDGWVKGELKDGKAYFKGKNYLGVEAGIDAGTIAIKPWDRKAIKDIEKGIMDSDVGITPENNGEVIRLAIPQPTEERRRDLVKQCNKIGEKTKVEVRNVRGSYVSCHRHARRAAHSARHAADTLKAALRQAHDGSCDECALQR